MDEEFAGPPGQWQINAGSLAPINNNLYLNIQKSINMNTNNISGLGIIDAAGTSNLTIRAGGTANQLVLSGNGNIGIKTASPSQSLDVAAGNAIVPAGYLRLGDFAGTPGAGDMALKRVDNTLAALYMADLNYAMGGGTGFGDVRLATAGTYKFYVTDNGNIVFGPTAALATNATNGFIYIPSMSGAPTGTPTGYTGKTAMVYNTAANFLHIYNGAWRSGAFA